MSKIADDRSKAPPNPLSSMQKLSDHVFLHRPSTVTTTSSDPKLILLLGWVGARDQHLVKYIQNYQGLFPNSSILLIKARVAVMSMPSIARQTVMPASLVVRELANDGTSSDRLSLLVHLFSNGGSCLLSTLYDVYAESADKAVEGVGLKQHQLPRHITIMDSAPASRFEYSKIVYSVMQGFPAGSVTYWLAFPVVHLLVMIWYLKIDVLGFSDEMKMWARSHNDPKRVEEVRRVYFYSDADAVVDREDVELHADHAEAEGFHVVKELFVGSPHVAHARSAPQTYWRLVEEAWFGPGHREKH